MIDIGFWLLWRPKTDVDHECGAGVAVPSSALVRRLERT